MKLSRMEFHFNLSTLVLLLSNAIVLGVLIATLLNRTEVGFTDSSLLFAGICFFSIMIFTLKSRVKVVGKE